MKVCTKCGIEKDESEFWNDKSKKSGKRGRCIECDKIVKNIYREENKDKIKEANRQWVLKNSEYIKLKNKEKWAKIKEKESIKNIEFKRCNKCNSLKEVKEFRKYRDICKDCFNVYTLKYNKQYYEKNKEKLLENHKQYNSNNTEQVKIKKREYYNKNKEYIKGKTREYTKNNGDKISENKKQYQKKQIRQIRETKSKYMKMKLQTDKSFRLSRNISRLFNKNLKNQYQIKKQPFSKYTGVAYADYIVYFEQNFPVEFSQITEKNKYHIDHIIPCAVYDFNNPDEIKLCWQPENLRIIPAQENLSKSDKLDFDLIEKHNIWHLLPESIKVKRSA